ncbi:MULTISPECIES: hypothetical protein [Candidatus Ichthyocystis]|uniref:Uncharacterized protein n=1 Tax=Candidatus Ichthyocystis hellenicum TaxID=1561003 RepID=A0A0S4M1F0_9BURK|nr:MULTISPECIES: hypothetical protein [Ichthyocystis]CUT17115.1 hypothetical protein Ark11_0258 [Candidatus Ichthyocystis hellenicum]
MCGEFFTVTESDVGIVGGYDRFNSVSIAADDVLRFYFRIRMYPYVIVSKITWISACKLPYRYPLKVTY